MCIIIMQIAISSHIKKLPYGDAKIRFFCRYPTKKTPKIKKKTFPYTDVGGIENFCIFASAFLKQVP